MLQSFLVKPFMTKDSKSLLLYQDDPASGVVVKTITLAVPLVLLIVSAYLLSSGVSIAFLALFAEAVIIGLVFSVIFPRKYQVYQDHIKIVFGGPFSAKVKFDQIKTIETTNKSHFTINYATTMTKSYVRIERKKGLNIAITPKSGELFVENANHALEEWVRTKQSSTAL